jgi:hypothetical protein
MLLNKTQAKTNVDYLDTALLEVDEGYQRLLGPVHVNSIYRDFDSAALAVIQVSQRGDGTYVVLDGRHRVEVCRRMGIREVLSQIHTGLTVKREADLFLKLNFERAPSAKHQFAAQVLSEDPETLTMLDIVGDAGFTLHTLKGPSASNLVAVSGMRGVLRRYGAAILRKSLSTIAAAWPDQHGGRDSQTIQGLALFHAIYPDVDDTTLHDKLRLISPELIRQRRDLHRSTFGGTTAKAGAHIILRQYNHRRSTRQLPNLLGE